MNGSGSSSSIIEKLTPQKKIPTGKNVLYLSDTEIYQNVQEFYEAEFWYWDIEMGTYSYVSYFVIVIPI